MPKKRINKKTHFYKMTVAGCDITSSLNKNTQSRMYMPWIVVENVTDINNKLIAEKAAFKFKHRVQSCGLLMPTDVITMTAYYDKQKKRLISISNLKLLNRKNTIALPPNQYEITGLIMNQDFDNFFNSRHKLDPKCLDYYDRFLKSHPNFKAPCAVHHLKRQYQNAPDKILMHIDYHKAVQL